MRSRLDCIDWDFSSFVPSGATAGIHSTHWYPGCFPPGLPATLLDILGKEADTVVDPFCGSGVAPVEAWLRGRRAIGLDINEHAVALCNAKVSIALRGTRELGARLVERYQAHVQERFSYWSGLPMGEVARRADFRDGIDDWFTPAVIRDLAIAKEWIGVELTRDEDIGQVLKVLVSSMLHRDLSRLRHVHYTYVVDRSRTKVPPPGHVDTPASLCRKIRDAMYGGQVVREVATSNGVALAAQGRPRFIRASVEDVASYLSRPVDLIITSPPYLGMNDYVRSQYLTWLVFPWEGFEAQIGAEIGSRRNRRRPDAYGEYLRAMRRALDAMRASLRVGGMCAFIVGGSNARTAGGQDLLASMRTFVEANGFRMIWDGERRVKFRKINNTPYRKEAIWVMQAV